MISLFFLAKFYIYCFHLVSTNRMRSEKEMMDLIMNFVIGDENVRAAVMNGSRTNPNAKKDFFQDYDIACFVNCVDPYVKDREFLKQFGERIINADAGGHGRSATQK